MILVYIMSILSESKDIPKQQMNQGEKLRKYANLIPFLKTIQIVLKILYLLRLNTFRKEMLAYEKFGIHLTCQTITRICEYLFAEFKGTVHLSVF